ncbi:hypothetical protein KBTX_04295 [wastewater metagenome]|uniref:Uncharacterized protein n=2 Tax=unclassified sequences TaxID=12908 RepID=A0A5B8RFU1_9ZZZZ|nr:hypothetical protein KBTEX_04295 [uncultured organism]
MEDVDHAEPVLRGELADAPEHVGELVAGDGAVHAVVIRRDAPDGRERGLATGPEAGLLGVVRGDLDARGAVLAHQCLDAFELVGNLGVGAVELADEDGGGPGVVAGVDEVLRRLDRRAVHHLQSARDHAGGDDRRDRVAAVLDVVERGHEHGFRRRLGQKLHGDLHDHREHALGTVHQRQQVIAGGVRGLRADGYQLAVDGHCGHLEDVVHGQPVLQAVHAAGVLGDVAADGAGDLGGGIRCIVQPVGGGGLGDRKVAHAGLDPRDAPLCVH